MVGGRGGPRGVVWSVTLVLCDILVSVGAWNGVLLVEDGMLQLLYESSSC